MTRIKTWIATLVAVLMFAAACGGSDSGAPESESPTPAGTQGGTFSFVNGEPTTLIPQNNYESYGGQVFEVLFTRLVSFDFDTGVPVPAQAESIELSDDGLTYTITIKDGWTFHNGEPVTAESYVDAWNYTAYGPNGFVLNFFFDRIVGYDELNPSKGKPTTKELSGLEVVDDNTFTVTLTAPFSQFEMQLGFDAFNPLPRAFYDDPDAYNEQPIGDGPYMMDGPWKHDETINLTRYPDYAGTPGYADNIELPIYSGDAGWLDFQAGNVDIITVGSSHLAEAKTAYADSLVQAPSSSIFFLGFPLYDERFQSKELRQALSMAIDRQAVMTAILINETPADDFVSPVIAGYRQGACTYCVFDVELAQQKLVEAGGWSGELTLNFPAEDAVLAQAMEAVANQWTENLGIQDITLKPINYNTMYELQASSKMTGPWWDGWVMDYPSMQNYLQPIYGANGGYNTVGYDNASFDDLLDQGDAAPTIDDSIPIYQQADDLLLEDVPAIPWGYGGYNTVNLPSVTNVLKNGPLDNTALELVQVIPT